MSTKFHRIKRLVLIVAGTAALSGTFENANVPGGNALPLLDRGKAIWPTG